MISRHSINNFTWIDLLSPTESEIRDIASEYNIEYFAARELALPTPKPKVRAYESGKYLCAVLHIPAFKHSHVSEDPQEIDFIIGRNLLITARYESIDALHTFERESDVENILGKSTYVYKHIFLHMMQEIQNCLFDELFSIEDWIAYIEQKIFMGEQKAMVMDISQASKNLLNFRKSIKPHRDIFLFLKEEGGARFGKLFQEGMDELLDGWGRLDEMTNNNLDMLLELRATNDSILTTKQNEVMKTLTVLAFMTIPASAIASIFNMQVVLPFIDTPHLFWIILSVMVASSLSMFLFFKYKKWL